jgi:ribonuclease T2
MKYWIKPIALSLWLIIIMTANGWAQISLSGYFIATENCLAMQSFKRDTNPGNVRLTPDMAYALIGKNKVEATHYRIRINDAVPKERWVSVSCGFILTDCQKSGVKTDSSSNDDPSLPEYLLAISWQPAFCQSHQSKNECRTQDVNRYDANHFTLHGLWPQPQSNIYCDVSNVDKTLDKRNIWEQLPQPDISSATFEDLIEIMPGVASYLHRHEWIKHGTCYSPTPEEYFIESIMLTEQINASVVREYFADNIGKTIPVSEIKAKFDEAFGPGSGDKVKVKCSNDMISELWINLKGEITSESRLSNLLLQAEPTSSKCQNGLVDPVGY